MLIIVVLTISNLLISIRKTTNNAFVTTITFILTKNTTLIKPNSTPQKRKLKLIDLQPSRKEKMMQDARPRKKEPEKRKKERLLSKDSVKQRGKLNRRGLNEIESKVKNKISLRKKRRKRNQSTGSEIL